MILPAPIARYFAADSSADAALLSGVFAPDAVVTDEGQTHAGTTAIDAWWRAAKAKYNHHAAPLEAETDGDAVTVRARVTGTFPGSPAILTFAFTLSGDRIAALRIY